VNTVPKVIAVISAVGLVSLIVGVSLIQLQYAEVAGWVCTILGAIVLFGGLLLQVILKKFRKKPPVTK
jgi:hypothetical protein